MDGKAISPGKKENPGGLSQITDKEEWLRDSEFSTYQCEQLNWECLYCLLCHLTENCAQWWPTLRSWNARTSFVYCKV